MIESSIRAAWPLAFILALVILLEQATPRTRVPMRERFPNAFYRIGIAVLIVAAAWPLAQLRNALGLQPLISLRLLHPALGIVAALLIIDFLRYVEHRAEHFAWWPVHSLHHAPTSVHASSVFAHPLIAIPEFLIISIPLSFIDIGVSGIAWLASIMTFQDLVIHSPLRVHLGPLRRVFNDNRFHRIHHSTEERHFDRNYGLFFTIWDQMFGTAYFPAKDEWPETGVAGVRPPESFADVLTHPVRFLMASRARSKGVPMPHELAVTRSEI